MNTTAGCDLHAHQINFVEYDLELNVLDFHVNVIANIFNCFVTAVFSLHCQMIHS